MSSTKRGLHMTLAQLKDIYARNDLTADELRVVVDRLNQQRTKFDTELPEIKPPVTGGWLPRSRSLQQTQINKNLCNHYKEQIQQWITLIECYERSLSQYEKVKRFVGKHKWFFVIATTVIAKSYGAFGVIEGWIRKSV
ncbi:TPA: hypothetical protein ACROI3_005671 [Klebsiella pneumoniae]|nr:hypothetical protein [Klebsiella pneumoniae]